MKLGYAHEKLIEVAHYISYEELVFLVLTQSGGEDLDIHLANILSQKKINS